MLSSYLAMLWNGHLEQLYHIFAYPKANNNSEAVFDLGELEVNPMDFQKDRLELSEFGD